MDECVTRKWIFGSPTIEDLVDTLEEREVGDSPYKFEAGTSEIVAEVQWEMAIKSGKIIEIDDSGSDPRDDKEVLPFRQEVIRLFEMLEKACLVGREEFSLDLPEPERRCGFCRSHTSGKPKKTQHDLTP